MSARVQQAATGLVDRARNGDQNAMAHLIEIARNKDSNPQAALAYSYAFGYAKRTPPAPVRPAFGYCGTGCSFGALKATKDGAAYGRSIIKFVLDMGPSHYDSRIAADVISDIRPLDRNALRLLMAGTPPDVRGAFALGYRDPLRGPQKAKGQALTPDEMKALQLGYIIGMAKRLQEIQGEDTPVSILSSRIGWELGE